MKLFGFGKNKAEKVAPVEVKKHGNIAGNHVDFLFSSYGTGILSNFISPQLAYKFYHQVSPLQGTVSKIADAIGALPLVLRNENEPDVLIKESEILDILKAPSPLSTKKQFLTAASISLMLTRELYIVARGPVTSPPIELVFIHGYNIMTMEDLSSDWPVKITTNVNGDLRDYFREDVAGRWRYFDRMRMNEIFPYISERSINPSGSYFRGISPLTALKDELLSYSASVLGNTFAIENGGRPSGILSPKDDDLGEDQYNDLVKSVKKHVTGPQNSGQILVTPVGVDAAFPQWAPKDMDYETLQKNVKTNIWNLYSMPFPIVSENNQTFSNTETAQLSFYDEAVNENWGILSDALKWILSTRYEMKDLLIDYNALEVPALRRRAVALMKEMSETEVLSVNEARNSGGFVDVEGGETILVKSMKTTLDAVIAGPSFDEPMANAPPK